MSSFKDTNDLEFLNSAYEVILGRNPDKDGLEYYMSRLAQGVPRFRVILDLMVSPEAKFRGVDLTEIEDVIDYYIKKKKTTPSPILDQKIAKKYSDRILNLFYRMRFSRPPNATPLVSNLISTPNVAATAPHPQDVRGYASTRRRCEAILEAIYARRILKKQDSVLDDALGIHVPRWAGVTNSTKSLLIHTFPIPLSQEDAPDQLSEDEIRAFIDVLSDSAFSQLIFSGGEYIHYRIAKAIKERAPRKIIKVIWHGSPLQLGPHYELDPFMAWVSACRSGVCDAIGFVKPGMSRLFDALNVRSHFLQNSIEFEPGNLNISDRPDNVGMWLSHVGSYRKPVTPTLFALSGLSSVTLQGAGFGEDGIRLIKELRIRCKSITPYTIPHAKVIEGMRNSKLTLYVTLSECMPMVPFESISQGAPCLVGPSAKIYDDEFLEKRLVVRDPFDSNEIKKKIEMALSDYTEIIKASIDFSLRARMRTKKSVIDFLG